MLDETKLSRNCQVIVIILEDIQAALQTKNLIVLIWSII
jgi:hypothetical protein